MDQAPPPQDRPSDRPAPEGGHQDNRRSSSLRRSLLFLGIGIVVAALLGVGLFTSRGSGNGGHPQAGDAVPTFSLASLEGGDSVGVPANGGGNGTPAVLLFFASWCVPCQAEIPQIAHLYSQERDGRSRLAAVRVVGVDGSDPPASALAFVQRSGVSFPVGRDSDYSVTNGKFGFTGLPEAVFVRADGTIAGIHYGAITPEQFTAWQRKLLTSS
ncbi:MAG TPA: TlpA disulfide reductase family protein [Acidimicrobiales bacterium]|nr:TlpA disulfide reductase family protein [Acidimicrobiales bacterium]